MAKDYKEYVGYRANTKGFVGEDCLVKNGCVALFSERRNHKEYDGYYGGDAYPVSFENTYEKNGKTYVYGMTLVADGVGQGNFLHSHLEGYLESKIDMSEYDRLPKEEREQKRTGAMLSVFLRTLFGGEIFSDSETLAYALKNFSNIPTDGFFAADTEDWHNNIQIDLPFYKRDSQNLGSRITCVAMFQRFRHYVRQHGLTAWDKNSAAELLREVEEMYSMEGELHQRVANLFTYEGIVDVSGIPQNDPKFKRYYFLPSTVAVWFYVHEKGATETTAVALNCGDARCYVMDLTDGVRQISVEDSKPNGEMTAIIHYGQIARSDETGYLGCHDLQVHARVVRLKMPCALFSCSDGVYDTCPQAVKDGVKISLPYANKPTVSNDFLFEANMLETVCRCHSYEEFRREIALNFYGGGSYDCVECTETESLERYLEVKRDDSGTIAAKFFGQNGGLEFFQALRQHKDETFIAKMYGYLLNQSNTPKIPYYNPGTRSSSEKNDKIREQYAIGEFKKLVFDVLRKEYPSCYEQMIADGSTTIWGLENGPNKVSGFSFGQVLMKNVNMVVLLNGVIDDWQQSEGGTSIPDDWKKYQHALAIPEIVTVLSTHSFDEKYKEFVDGGVDLEAEAVSRLHKWFEESFLGYTSENEPHFDEIIGEDELTRAPFEERVQAVEAIYNQLAEEHRLQNGTATEATEDPVTVATAVEQPATEEASANPVNVFSDTEYSENKNTDKKD